MIEERKRQHDDRTSEDFFVGIFNRKISELFLKQAYIPLHIKASEIRSDKWEKLFSLCKHFQVEIEETNPFEQAQVCSGGVDTSEVHSKTMESRLHKGLYFAGELLDIDGTCGGYNLQWAWSSGAAAGIWAAK